MYFTKESLAVNAGGIPVDRNMQNHWADLWKQRNSFNVVETNMLQQHGALQANAVGGFAKEFWAEIDRNVVESRAPSIGFDLIDDLLRVQTTLDVGKTVRGYNVGGEIAKDVSISIDGQAPYSFDHTDYATDADPIPMFSAGYGVNWRHARGLSSVGVDLVLDSQRAKLREFNKKIVAYMKFGDARIKVDGYEGQGITNHRNTKKIDLNVAKAGALLDLTIASAEEISAFFTNGAFATTARANGVLRYDILWVSPEIYANLSKGIFVNGVLQGTVLQTVMQFVPAAEIKPTFFLSGNEFIAYQRDRQVISPLVGMPVGVTALPRPLPQTNFNFQILAALGLQITKDEAGRGGVVYGAKLT